MTTRAIKEITLKNEHIYLELLVLETEYLKKKNSMAKEVHFYGKRLHTLMVFYNKNTLEVGSVLHLNRDKISLMCNNDYVPTEKQIERLAFLFEVPKEYFTQDEIKIKINEQIKIELCQ